MSYSNILSRAWKITWKHKILWIFGILAGCSSGGNGGGNRFNFSGGPGGPGFPGGQAWQQFTERPEFTAILIGIILLAILVGLAIFVLSVIGRGGLIGGAQLADEKGSVTFGEAWAIGVRSFWRIFLIGLVIAIPFLIVLVLTVAGSLITAGLGLICLLPLLCLTIIALIPASIVAHFAQFAVVIDGLGVMDALRKGWEILKTNLGPIIVLGAILLGISFVAGLILAAPLLALVVPIFLAMAASQGDFQNVQTGVMIAAGLGFLCYLPILIVLSGVLQTWVMSAWTLAYRHFTGHGAPAPAAPAAPAPAV